jgi:hypothetical protein
MQKIESSDGGTNPFAPSGGAVGFVRTSLSAAGLKVPTFRNSLINSPPASIMAGLGGGVYLIRAVVHIAVPWQDWQLAEMNKARPATTAGSVDTGEIGGRIPELHKRLNRIPGVHSMHLELIPVGARERKEVEDVGVLGYAVRRHDQTHSAGDRANVQFEILFFVALRGPVQRALVSSCGIGEIEICVLRNRALWSRGEDPDDIVRKPEGMTC